MSNSFFERANPPPRRKTCIACTKAKRRCDHNQPACLRCSRRKIDCIYPGPPTYRSNSRATCNSPQGSPQNDPASPTETPAAIPVEGPYSNTTLVLGSQGPDLLPIELGDLEDISLDIGFDELLTPDAFLDASLSFSPIIPKPDQMLVPLQDCQQPGSLDDMIASRIQYALDVMKKAPASMVMENQVPWSHAHLYRASMPREMQDAQACCALYVAKNSSNSPFVLRTIQARAHELLSSPMPKGRLEVLARIHAILLYQIIRLFDGDISMRAYAQQTLCNLEPAVHSLLPFVKWDTRHVEIGPAEDHSLCPTKDFWQEWIFQESARRTIFFTYFFLITYQVLIGQASSRCDEKYLFCESWTLSAHLWNAHSVVDFAIAWKEKKHFVVTKHGFNEVLRDAAADDIDLFGKMLVVGALGIDEARLWFYNKGGSL